DKIIEYAGNKYDMMKEHFNFIKVKGYDEDEEKVTEVDLIKDRMLQFISYSESKNMIDIRPKERKDQIILAYEKIEKDLNKYFLNHCCPVNRILFSFVRLMLSTGCFIVCFQM